MHWLRLTLTIMLYVSNVCRSQLKVKKFRSSTHFYSTSNNATPPPGVDKTSPETEKGGATSDDSGAKKIDETTSKILANFQPSQWNVAGVRSSYDNLSQKVLAIYQDKMTQAKAGSILSNQYLRTVCTTTPNTQYF